MRTLFQETWRTRPFWLLVGCILVNRATWRKAEPIMGELFERYGGVISVFAARPSTLEEIVRPLGFQRVRARRIKALARAMLAETPKTREDVLAIPGCGAYAADSFAIFVLGDLNVRPTDSKLKEYVRDHRPQRMGHRIIRRGRGC